MRTAPSIAAINTSAAIVCGLLDCARANPAPALAATAPSQRECTLAIDSRTHRAHRDAGRFHARCRATPVVDHAKRPGAETVIDGRRFLYFAGTGYLGLQGHPALVEAARDAATRYGIHTATTRTTFGTSPPVAEVERRAARLLGMRRRAVSGQRLCRQFRDLRGPISPDVDLAFIDETAHDCLRESTRWLDHLARPPIVFRHRDPQHLAELLSAHVQPSQRPLLMSDGLFPISGRLAPLADYLAIAANYAGAMLLVDDAHGIAAIGPQGRGCLELAGVDSPRINRGHRSNGRWPGGVSFDHAQQGRRRPRRIDRRLRRLSRSRAALERLVSRRQFAGCASCRGHGQGVGDH